MQHFSRAGNSLNVVAIRYRMAYRATPLLCRRDGRELKKTYYDYITYRNLYTLGRYCNIVTIHYLFKQFFPHAVAD